MLNTPASDPTCPTCSQAIAPGSGLAFTRRDLLIHEACLPGATAGGGGPSECQRRALSGRARPRL